MESELPKRRDAPPPNSRFGTAFLLAQVGAHAAKQFADRLSALKLTPPQTGILRRLAHAPGISQRELATRLGMHASRLVGVVDEMESLGLVVREGNAGDRRSYSLQLTPKGQETLAEAGAVSRQHNEAICAGLSDEERDTLAGLLQRIADRQGLIPGVHPGFSTIGRKARRSGRSDPPEGKDAKKTADSDAADD